MMLCLADLMKKSSIRLNTDGIAIGTPEEEARLTGCDKLLLLYCQEANELARGEPRFVFKVSLTLI